MSIDSQYTQNMEEDQNPSQQYQNQQISKVFNLEDQLMQSVGSTFFSRLGTESLHR